MISSDYAARQIGGALKMAMGAKDWRASLGRTADDVFAALAALAIAAPLVILATLAAKRAALRIPDLGDTLVRSAPIAVLVVGDLVTYALDVAASLALLVMLARATGVGKQAAELIIGYAWIQPVIVAAQLPAIALTASTASRTAGGLLALPALVLTIALIWGIVRRGLNAKPAPAAAIVVMLVVVGAVIDLLVAAGLRGLFAPQA
jgi:hypothetical protein